MNHLILDYVAMVEQFGPPDFEDFADMWMDADAIARSTIGGQTDDLELDLTRARVVRERDWPTVCSNSE